MMINPRLIFQKIQPRCWLYVYLPVLNFYSTLVSSKSPKPRPAFYYLPLFICCLLSLSAYSIDVPEHLDFAGMRLKIKTEVRQKMQTDVDRLSKPSKYTNAKLERIRLYFPIIERILAEEGLPNEFKYLVIQESDLISDAVSTSNAVGFWQFKRETALEMGLTVNNDVDERKHIVSSTRAAARYLKRNNFYFNNWIYALMAYNTGVGGAKNLIGDGDRGATRMEISNDTHWYIVKFLAHQVAFERATATGPIQPVMALLEYPGVAGQQLSDIAGALNVNEEELASYNKWLSSRRIPEDKPYTVIVPVPADQATVIAARSNVPVKQPVQFNYEYNYDVEADARQSAKYPLLKKKEGVLYEINGRPGIRASTGDNVTTLANKGGISVGKFLRYNDMVTTDAVVSNQVYYLKKKRNKGKLHFHTYIEGENLWQISQKYGIRLASLRSKNRLAANEKPAHGQVLWLRFRRPASKPVEIRNVPDPSVKTTPALITKNVRPAETMVKQTTVTDANGRMSTQPQIVPVPKTTTPASQKTTPPPITAEPVIPRPSLPGPEAAKPQPEAPAEVPAPAIEELVLLRGHRVQPGETLYSLARQYGVTVAQLRQWNNLNENDGLRIGQQLIVNEENAPQNSSPATARTAPPPVVISPVPAAAAAEHIVQAGETLYSIARRYSVSVASLRQWNQMTDTDGVQIGQKLLVQGNTPKTTLVDTTRKAPASSAARFVEYQVQPGDTLYKIAKAYNVTVAQLLEWNNKTVPDVSIGEKLTIRK